jgi:DNA helicase II / ATP-dependent DNA helicase PcrA
MPFAPSPAQAAFFNWIDNSTGNAVLVAVAGAGKTTTLIEGIRRMHGRVFFGVYSSSMGAEIKGKVALLDRKDVFASTIHSAGFRQLKYTFKNAELRTDGRKCAIIAETFVANRPDLETYLSCAVAVVSMAKQRGIGALPEAGNPNDNATWQAMIDHFDLAENMPESFRMDILIGFARAILKKSNEDLNVIDYDDMVYLPLHRNLRMLQHDWVLLDEAQDNNPVRRALAKRMLRRGGRFVAVGDPHQSIFGFTGADNDSLAQITAEFKAVELPLTVTYRCPKAVVEVARTWVSHIEAHETAPEGEYKSIRHDDLLLPTNVKIGDAILCRFNKYIVRTAFALIRAGIPAKIEGRAVGQGLMALATKWKVKNLDTLLTRLATYRDKEVAAATAKKDDAKVERINDQIDTLVVLIERTREQGGSTVDDLKVVIDSMFADDVAGDVVTLCSLHRSKGREWDTVYILGLNEFFGRGEQPWMQEQEVNLLYVGVTRAKQTLINVTGVKEERPKYA